MHSGTQGFYAVRSYISRVRKRDANLVAAGPRPATTRLTGYSVGHVHRKSESEFSSQTLDHTMGRYQNILEIFESLLHSEVAE